MLFCSNEPYAIYKKDKNHQITKIKNNNIVLDGNLYESIWKDIDIIDDFLQAEPIYQSDPSKRTNVQIVYDDQYLYLGVTLFDSRDNIIGRMAQYDSWYEGFENKSDYFIVEIDSWHNHQTSYCFAVNSLGVKSDYMIYDDDPEKIDDDWDARWQSATSMNDDSWTIEYKIPLSILKFKNNKDMGINFIRYIKKNNEYLSWVLLPREKKGIVSHYGHITNLEIDQQKYLSVKPYILNGKTQFNDRYFSSSNTNLDINDVQYLNTSIRRNKFGLDLSYLINSNTQIDISLNPDFGQVEQDPSEINLTGYETYFEEKRDFFKESSALFETPIDVFYTRRIGGDLELNNEKHSTKLNTAIKLTKKSENEVSYALILSQGEYKIDTLNIYNKIYNSVFRVSKNILDGKSSFGVIGTNYNDKINSSGVVGIDGLFYFYDNRMIFDGQIASSSTNNQNGLGTSFELSFQDKVNSENCNYLLKDKIIESWVNGQIYDENFDISKIGYLERNDFQKFNLGVAFSQEKTTKLFNNYSFDMQFNYASNTSGVSLIKALELNYKAVFSNYWTFGIGASRVLNHYNDRLYDYYLNSTESKIVKMPSSYKGFLSISSPPINDFNFSINTIVTNNELNDNGKNLYFLSNYKLTKWFDFELGYGLHTSNEKYHFLMIRQKPHFGETPRKFDFEYNLYTESQEYLFTKSDNMEKHLTLRTSIYFKNNISTNMYLEYFVNQSNFGDTYSKLLNDFSYPEGNFLFTSLGNLEEINLRYNAKYTSAILNFVFQWEYKPNSNLYVVYSYYKQVNGMRFNNFKELIEYENINNDLTETFYDQSLFLKCDYWFDI